jgi:hypothetical protein
MSRTNGRTKKSSLRRRAQQRRRRQKMMSLFAVGIGFLFLGGAFLLVRKQQPPTRTFTYTLEDVTTERPIQAVHEMTGPTLNEIPFLPKDGPQPKIVVLEDFYNFGLIGPTDIVTHDFVIKNEGDAPLTIYRAYTTCGCTTADFSGTIIPPGKVAIVTLRLDAGYHDVRGQTVRRGVIIENNDPNHPQVELWTQASVGR